MALSVLPGYPTSLGNKYMVVAERNGLASYVQVPTGGGPGFPAGADLVVASTFGMGGIDSADTSYYTDSGTYYVEIVYYGTGFRGSVPSVALRWSVTATSAEVAGAVNLSAETIRFTIIGV